MTDVRDRAVQLASQALTHYMAGRKQEAADTVQAICDETGSTGLAYAMCGWIDTVAARMRRLGYITGAPGSPVQPAWVDDASGRRASPDDVPVPHLWAARLAAARESRDLETWAALLSSLPEDSTEASKYIWALLSGAALTIKGTPPARRAALS